MRIPIFSLKKRLSIVPLESFCHYRRSRNKRISFVRFGRATSA